MTITFKGAAKRLDDLDLPRIGSLIGVGEDELHAFMEVEAAGSGFDAQGRPKMLFEPHVFYRNLGGEKLNRAVREGLAYKSWKAGAYPKDSYPRLLLAMEIDETAALKAASWGLGQILGENYSLVGYLSPQAMVSAFVESEAAQLEAIVAFLKSKKLDGYLRDHKWVPLAEGYNGKSQAEHNYSGRLASAYARWSKIKDTPWPPKPANTSDAVPLESLPTAPSDPPPARIVSVEPIPKNFWQRLTRIFGA